VFMGAGESRSLPFGLLTTSRHSACYHLRHILYSLVPPPTAAPHRHPCQGSAPPSPPHQLESVCYRGRSTEITSRLFFLAELTFDRRLPSLSGRAKGITSAVRVRSLPTNQPSLPATSCPSCRHPLHRR
jgi:hypothetical protein